MVFVTNEKERQNILSHTACNLDQLEKNNWNSRLIHKRKLGAFAQLSTQKFI